MPHNFRFTGNFYVSKDGNDANPGTDPNAPKASITSAVAAQTANGQTIIIGAGVYQESFTNTRSGTKFQGDGTVIIDCPAAGGATIVLGSSVAGAGEYVNNCVIRNFSAANNSFVGIVNALTNGAMVNCRSNSGIFGNRGEHVNSIFVNVSNVAASVSVLATRCIFINASFAAVGSSFSLNSCYVNTGSSFISHPTTLPINNLNSVTFSDFRGTLTTGNADGNRLVALGQDKAGNPVALPPGAIDAIVVSPNIYTTQKCFTQDPEFLNPTKGDFISVAPTSPLIRAGFGNVNIGNVQTGKYVKANTAELLPTNGATLSRVTLNVGDLVLDGTADINNPGLITSAPIQVSSNVQVIDLIQFFTRLNFDRTDTPGTADNTNVPFATEYTITPPATPPAAGANPRRLTYEMRWSTSVAAPTTDADWDNNSYGTAGDYFLFELNSIPRVSFSTSNPVLVVGNGTPDFNNAASGRIAARWVQIRITLRFGIR